MWKRGDGALRSSLIHWYITKMSMKDFLGDLGINRQDQFTANEISLCLKGVELKKKELFEHKCLYFPSIFSDLLIIINQSLIQTHSPVLIIQKCKHGQMTVHSGCCQGCYGFINAVRIFKEMFQVFDTRLCPQNFSASAL